MSRREASGARDNVMCVIRASVGSIGMGAALMKHMHICEIRISGLVLSLIMGLRLTIEVREGRAVGRLVALICFL